jgi:hypothetical protein
VSNSAQHGKRYQLSYNDVLQCVQNFHINSPTTTKTTTSPRYPPHKQPHTRNLCLRTHLIIPGVAGATSTHDNNNINIDSPTPVCQTTRTRNFYLRTHLIVARVVGINLTHDNNNNIN